MIVLEGSILLLTHAADTVREGELPPVSASSAEEPEQRPHNEDEEDCADQKERREEGSSSQKGARYDDFYN